MILKLPYICICNMVRKTKEDKTLKFNNILLSVKKMSNKLIGTIPSCVGQFQEE
jgi:hypothetical protein